MNILVIGSKGFIGSHCASFFLVKHNVWQCDVVVDYTTQQYIQVDSTNADYTEVMQLCDFDVCINCSGAANVSDSLKNPQRDFMLNTTNVFKQLDAIRKFNSNCKYINISSAAVYGNPKSLPISESHALNPISPYGLHKRMAEDICKEFYEIYKIQTCSLRVFSAYGDGLRKQLFWDLYKKINEQSTIELFGTGNETRDFIYISDLVNAIETVINNSQFNNDIINIANGEQLSIKYVAETFGSIFDKKLQFKFLGNSREGDPKNWVADLYKLKNLGYKQKIRLEDGLKNYFKWIQENG
ncbi:NAD-dependent epimerase/dehydratase family protein [Psychroserpens sp.]